MKLRYFIRLLVALVLVSSCRKDPQPLPDEKVSVPAEPGAVLKGFYLVNEGNMN
ncbi:MAG: YncE family protein, partial [Pedobacter sp.]